MASRKKNKVVKKTTKKKVASRKKSLKQTRFKSNKKKTAAKKTTRKKVSKRKAPVKKSSKKKTTTKKSPAKRKSTTKKLSPKPKSRMTNRTPKKKSQLSIEQETINKLLTEIKSLEHNNYQLAKQLEKTKTKKEIISELKSYLSNLRGQPAGESYESSPESEAQTRFELEQAKERAKNKDKLISRLKTLVSSGGSSKPKLSKEPDNSEPQVNQNNKFEEHSIEEIRHTYPSSVDAHLDEMKPVEIKVEESRIEESDEPKVKETKTVPEKTKKDEDPKASPEEVIFQRVAQIEREKEKEVKKYQTNKKRGVISADEAEYFSDKLKEMAAEINKVFIGQDAVVKDVLISVLCDAHSLLEGVPGLAKTLLIETLGLVIDGTTFKRIQFLPDLLPSDIIGGQVFNPKTAEYTIYKGPIFANFVLADEINRAPPKTHAAIMEAMQEKKINIENETFILDRPFFVLATQNPLENKGTYELPEAVLDRFMFKIMLDYPLRKHELMIITENATTKDLKKNLKPILTKEDVLEIQRKVKQVYISNKIREFIMDLVEATRGKNKNIEGIKFVKYGAGVRASIYLCLAAQANAVFEGRNYVLPDDVLAIAYSVLRHRVVVNYRGKAHNITPEKVVDEILSKVKAL